VTAESVSIFVVEARTMGLASCVSEAGPAATLERFPFKLNREAPSIPSFDRIF